jgi:DNA-binding response OmpR family regulator
MKRILYVEDSTTSQLLMRKYLQDGYELSITPSLRDAEVKFAQGCYDLVITDFLFPEADAMQLIAKVRVQKSPSELPILVVSSSMDAVLLARVLKTGANEGLSKPLNAGEFRTVVQRLLAESYVRELERSISSVSCFQWAGAGRVYQYCPELNVTLEGADAVEVGQQMLALLKERTASGASLGITHHERVVTHLVEN